MCVCTQTTPESGAWLEGDEESAGNAAGNGLAEATAAAQSRSG